MKNNHNIYDIDGEVIRDIKDMRKWDVEKCQERINYYKKRIEEVGEDDRRAQGYAVYIKNLNKYMLQLYANMDNTELLKYINKAKEETTDEQIQKAMEELKNDLESEETGESEGGELDNEMEQPMEEPTSEPKETIMDEYVDYEEVNE